MKNSKDKIIIERRQFLQMPIFAALGAMTVLKADLESIVDVSKISFDDFVVQVGSMAKKLIATEEKDRNEADYLSSIATLATKLETIPEIKLGEPFKGIIRTGLNYRGSGIIVVQWSMEAGLSYPAHNHPNYNGITLGIEGECNIRNFNIVGKSPDVASSEKFFLEETQNQILLPGKVASVMSTNKDNIHKLQTGSKAIRGIDVNTLVGKHMGFSFIEIDENSRNERGVYQAQWGESRSK